MKDRKSAVSPHLLRWSGDLLKQSLQPFQVLIDQHLFLVTFSEITGVKKKTGFWMVREFYFYGRM
jgi:hypothetical protein